MEVSNTMRHDGAMVYWGLPQFTDRILLDRNLKALGFDLGIEQRSGTSVLQDAILAAHPGTGLIVRPLARKVKGFSVSQEERGLRENKTDFSCSYWLEGTNERITSHGNDALPFTVTDHFKGLRDTLRSQQVTLFLQAILRQLNAVRLSPKHTTGIYWVPESVLDRWKNVGHAVAGASFEGASFYAMGHSYDADGIRAIKDGLIREAEAEADAIGADVMGGKLKVEALNNRVLAAKAMREKVQVYEGLLNETLDGLKAKLDQAEGDAAMAAMLASVDELRAENERLAAR